MNRQEITIYTMVPVRVLHIFISNYTHHKSTCIASEFFDKHSDMPDNAIL